MSEIYREGIITKGIGGFYYVESAGGITECRARGKFRKMELTPIVGDRVVVRVPETGGAELCEIKPRKNRLCVPACRMWTRSCLCRLQNRPCRTCF